VNWQGTRFHLDAERIEAEKGDEARGNLDFPQLAHSTGTGGGQNGHSRMAFWHGGCSFLFDPVFYARTCG